MIGVDDPGSILKILFIQLPFYLIFIVNSFIDSLFHHLGKSKQLLIQSIVVNSLYYGLLFVLWSTGLFVPSLASIALMFGGGIVVDFLVTFYQAKNILAELFFDQEELFRLAVKYGIKPKQQTNRFLRRNLS